MYGLDHTHTPAPASIRAQVLNLRDLVHRFLPVHFGFILSLALEFKFIGLAHAGFTDGFSPILVVTIIVPEPGPGILPSVRPAALSPDRTPAV